jgi:hypothetical protein
MESLLSSDEIVIQTPWNDGIVDYWNNGYKSGWSKIN